MCQALLRILEWFIYFILISRASDYMPGTILGSENVAENKIDKNPCPCVT